MTRRLELRHALCLGVAGALIGGWALPPANAADLGGNCCADLEERIAELEATTARKGNRKVSLTVSGWVSEQVAFWDDGTESNVYVGTNPVDECITTTWPGSITYGPKIGRRSIGDVVSMMKPPEEFSMGTMPCASGCPVRKSKISPMVPSN